MRDTVQGILLDDYWVDGSANPSRVLKSSKLRRGITVEIELNGPDEVSAVGEQSWEEQAMGPAEADGGNERHLPSLKN